MRTLARIARAALVAEFAIISGCYIVIAIWRDRGMDAHIYYRAVERWLSGQNPWEAAYNGVTFAAPPPTLLFMAPMAWLPEDVAVGVMMALSAGAAVFVLRRLRLPGYWLLFPPLVEGITVGNPNILVAALLLTGAGALAPLGKVYAAVPLVLLGRWRSLLVATVLVTASGPILPWDSYLSADTLKFLDAQSGGRSATELPWLIPLVVVALCRLGRERAAWLIVPALWPATQLHYAVLALPAVTGAMAAFMAVPLPGSAAVGVIVGAVVLEVQRRVTPHVDGLALREQAPGTIGRAVTRRP